MSNGIGVSGVLTVAAVCLCLSGVGGSLLPVKPKFKLNLTNLNLDSSFIFLPPGSPLIKPRIPIIKPLPLRVPTTTQTPMTTPDMFDSNWNFTQPGALAANCLSAEGNLVQKCQSKATADWDPARLNTTDSTTWETCCALFEELDCYLTDARTICPGAYGDAVGRYAKKVAYYFHRAICQSVSFSNWKQSCSNASHAAAAAAHSSEIDNNPDAKPSFVQLPKDDGPESACFIKLRSRTGTDLEQQCQNQSLNKWDPSRHKYMDSGVQDSCCAIYDTLDCVQQKSVGVCSETEQTDMSNYKQKSVVAFSQTICKAVPYTRVQELCRRKSSSKGGSWAVLPSAVLLSIAAIVSVVSFIR